jgi:hypothetical protein
MATRAAFDPLRTFLEGGTWEWPDRNIKAGVRIMRRVLIMLDVTETEAEHVVAALVPVSSHFENVGISEAFDQVRSAAPIEARGLLLQIRSRASAKLAGPDTDIVYQEIG